MIHSEAVYYAECTHWVTPPLCQLAFGLGRRNGKHRHPLRQQLGARYIGLSRKNKQLLTLLAASVAQIVSAANYYVATNGNNGSTGTSWDMAWRTISYAVTRATTGDAITVRAGRYEERVTIGQSGLLLQAEYPAVIGWGLDLRGCRTNTIGTQRASCRGFTVNSTASRNNVIRGFEITQIGSGNYRGISLNASSSNTIELCYLHELEPDVYAGDGIGSSVQCTNNVVRSNACYKVEGTGISLTGRGNLIVGNDVYRGRSRRTDGTEIGLDADATRCFGCDNTWRWNYLHDYWFSEQGYAPFKGPHMDGIMLFTVGTDGGVISNNVFDANVIYSVDDQAINTSDTYGGTPLLSHIVLINNVFWNCGTGGWSDGIPGYSVNIYDSPSNVIANNIFIRYGSDARGTNGISYPINLGDGAKSGCPGSRIQNNIFYGYPAGVNSRPVLQGGSAVGTVVDYNLWNSSVTRTASPQDDHSIFGTDPLFLDVKVANFALAAQSPAVKSGVNLSVFFDTDATRKLRPPLTIADRWDRGPKQQEDYRTPPNLHVLSPN